MELENLTPDVNDGALESPTAAIGSETETATPDLEQLNVTATEAENPEESEFDAEIEKQLAEKPQDKTDLKFFREQIKTLLKEKKSWESKTPEYSEADRYALDLYNGLNAFDNEKGVPTAKPFAEALAKKDLNLAEQAAWDLMNQSVDENGMTIGHKLLEKIGLDPYRLQELREFSQNKVKSPESIPEIVPPEYAEAYKQLSPRLRETLEWQLESDDPEDKKAAMEALEAKQYKIDTAKAQEAERAKAQESFYKEVVSDIERTEAETYNTFVESFRESPTYTNATISGNPTLDTSIKESINLQILALGYPDSVLGQQAQKYFQSLGVQVDQNQVADLLREISGNNETAVKARKGGFAPQEAEAVARRDRALQKANALRNRLFAEAVTKYGGALKQVSQAKTPQGGIPNLSGQGGSFQQDGKTDTLSMIKQMVGK